MRSVIRNFLLIFGLSCLANAAFGKEFHRTEANARFLWQLLNGTQLPADNPIASQVENTLRTKSPEEAALVAINSGESNVVTGLVRRIFTPLAGREVNFNEPSGDFIVTWMAAATLDIPIRDLFLTDIRYTFAKSRGRSTDILLNKLRTDKSFEKALRSLEIQNERQDYIDNPAFKAGIITSQQYGQSVFEGGTNRRVVKKLAEDFLCVPNIENIMNFRIPDSWVGRDIPRAPGNDPRVYLSKCVGCHAGIDSIRGAFAGYRFKNNSSLVWDPIVDPKLNNNPSVAPYGRLVVDHSWQHLGYLPIGATQIGKTFEGPLPLMQMLVDSPQLYSCLVKRTAEALCPEEAGDGAAREKIAYRFKKGQNLKKMIGEVAVQICMKGLI